MNLPAYVIFAVFLVELNFPLVIGEVCYVGKPSSSGSSSIGKWSYTLTPRDPCECTRLIITGHIKQDIVLSEDVNTIRRYFNINCPDFEKPVISNIPSNIVQNTDGGVATATVSWTEPSASDNSGSLTITSTHRPGASFPIGDTLVTYTAIDLSRNIAVGYFIVTVQDQEEPVFNNALADIVQNTDSGAATAAVNWIAPSASDNSGYVTLRATHNPGVSFAIGVTVVSYTAMDLYGNIATLRFSVTIQDMEKPLISNIPVNVVQNTRSGIAISTVNWTAPSASDNSGYVTLISTHSPGESFPIGYTMVSYTATDPSGNILTEMVTVTVNVPCRYAYPLGMEDGRIRDSQLSSSSFYGGDRPKHGRLKRPSDWLDIAPITGSYGGWCASDSDPSKWIQVDFGESVSVAGIIMQGRSRYKTAQQWVSKYKVQYSKDGALWQNVMKGDNQEEKVFDGPLEYSDTAVTSLFQTPVDAKLIRILLTEWIGKPCLRFEILGCKGFCVEPLGMKDGRILDGMISGSSLYDIPTTAFAARLDGPLTWIALIQGDNQWLQVDFGVSRSVSGIVIQGDSTDDFWVNKYKVQHSNSDNSWTYVQDANQDEMVFDGPSERNTPVASLFPLTIMVTLLRICPTVWYQQIALRLEILGCKALCVHQLGMEDGRITDGQISASTSYNGQTSYGPKYARLNREAATVSGNWTQGGWRAQTDDLNQWIQVDFVVSRSVSGIMLQGRHAHLEFYNWVTKFKIGYQRDSSSSWHYVQESNEENDMVFIGNSDRDTAVTSLFPHMINAMYVRILPIEWNNAISLRFEILGCDCSGNTPLGLADNSIPDNQMTASNELSSGWYASDARLDNNGAWASPIIDQQQWIQVVFNDVELVVGIVSQGYGDAWITEFTVQYSEDPKTDLVMWWYITTPTGWPNPKVFAANTDISSKVTNMFPQPVSASALRIRPMEWHHAFNLRLEILKCQP